MESRWFELCPIHDLWHPDNEDCPRCNVKQVLSPLARKALFDMAARIQAKKAAIATERKEEV